MEKIKNYMSSVETRVVPPQAEDAEETKYLLIMHRLCKRCGVEDPVEKIIFSTIENMSRRGLCLYLPEKLATYSGGTVSAVETALRRLEAQDLVVRGKMKNTTGWKLTDPVRKYANFLKEKIDRMGKDNRSHNYL